jgi:hypothetical protein
MYKGVKKNQHYTWLICAAQNMKNISIKKEKVNGKPLINISFIDIIAKYIKKITNIFKKNYT